MPAKRPTSWWGACLIVLVAIIGFGGAGSAIWEAIFGKAQDGSLKAQVAELAAFLPSLLLIWAWLTIKEGRAFSTLGFVGDRRLARIVGGFAIGVLLMATSCGLLVMLGIFEQASNAGAERVGTAALGVVLLLTLTVFVQSSTEEILVRGFLTQSMARQLSSGLAIVLPSAYFAVIHLTFTPFVLANIFIVALFFTFVSLRQGTLWMVCGIHAGWNWAQGNLLGVPVSGHPIENSIFRFGPGDSWLTGGDFGIEGSAIATLVLTAALAVAYRQWRGQRAASHAAA